MTTTNPTTEADHTNVYELTARVDCDLLERAVEEFASAQNATITGDHLDLRLQVAAPNQNEGYRRAVNLIDATLAAGDITEYEITNSSVVMVA